MSPIRPWKMLANAFDAMPNATAARSPITSFAERGKGRLAFLGCGQCR
jgi:hypothetical protein